VTYTAVVVVRLKFGLLTGAFMASQIGSIYYRMFLVSPLPLAGAVQRVPVPPSQRMNTIGAFAAGAAVAVSVAALYSRRPLVLAGPSAVVFSYVLRSHGTAARRVGPRRPCSN
jgi:hypothetical protein